MEFETPRLLLKPLSHADFAFFSHLHQQPQVMRFVSDIPTTDALKQRFNDRICDWHKEDNSWLTLIMIEKSSSKPVGLTGFLSEWQPYQQAELGFLIDPKFQGVGYGKESTLKVMDFAFQHCQFHKLTATVTEGNDASSNLLISIGFQLEGRLRDNYQINGKWFNDLKYGMLHRDYVSRHRQ